MIAMGKWALIAVTAGVWVTAVGSAAALTYDLNRPLRSANVTWHRSTRLAAQPNTSVSADVESLSEHQTMLRIPTITIVAESVESHAAVAPAPVTDISQMSCSDWRELDIGSGHVQVCE